MCFFEGDDEEQTERDNVGLVSTIEKSVSYSAVGRKLKHPVITLVLIYFVTLTIFPGVPAEDVHVGLDLFHAIA